MFDLFLSHSDLQNSKAGGITMSVHGQAKKVTTHTLQEMKRAGEKITMLTAYDYSLAKLVDSGGVDVILVGDSASNVMAGQVTTVPMTLDHMIYHAQCCLLYTSPSPRDGLLSRMPSSA